MQGKHWLIATGLLNLMTAFCRPHCWCGRNFGAQGNGFILVLVQLLAVLLVLAGRLIRSYACIPAQFSSHMPLIYAYQALTLVSDLAGNWQALIADQA